MFRFRPILARPTGALAAVVAVLMLAGMALVAVTTTSPDGRADERPSPTASVARPRAAPPGVAAPDPQPVPEPAEPAGVLDPGAEVSVDVDGFLAWAARDRTTGQTLTSDNADSETTSTESMIKAWIVADYLRRVAEDGDEPSEASLRDASRAIRDSHNGAAERLYAAGGRDATIARMIDICELTDTFTPEGDEGWWSRTETSALDAVRLGECLVDGRAAGPEWTDWVLAEMRAVRGTTAAADQRPEEGFEGGRWGIIDGLPPEINEAGVAIKNGWTRIGRTDSWHLNCLAVTEEWVMAVLMRYPAHLPLDYGAERCALVAEQLIPDRPEPGAVPEVM
jgi:hypothetical protein